MSPKFNALYAKIGKMFFNVRQAMMACTPPISIEELKSFLEELNIKIKISKYSQYIQYT